MCHGNKAEKLVLPENCVMWFRFKRTWNQEINTNWKNCMVQFFRWIWNYHWRNGVLQNVYRLLTKTSDGRAQNLTSGEHNFTSSKVARRMKLVPGIHSDGRWHMGATVNSSNKTSGIRGHLSWIHASVQTINRNAYCDKQRCLLETIPSKRSDHTSQGATL